MYLITERPTGRPAALAARLKAILPPPTAADERAAAVCP
jgi:hypothetical protein